MSSVNFALPKFGKLSKRRPQVAENGALIYAGHLTAQNQRYPIDYVIEPQHARYWKLHTSDNVYGQSTIFSGADRVYLGNIYGHRVKETSLRFDTSFDDAADRVMVNHQIEADLNALAAKIWRSRVRNFSSRWLQSQAGKHLQGLRPQPQEGLNKEV